jgi:phosphoglycolate phosphatase-like HAD superfamily hydrolase
VNEPSRWVVAASTFESGNRAVSIEPGSVAAYARGVSDHDAPLVVGFDLDMTLIDTVPGFAANLIALGDELGVEFPVEDITARLGPPLETLFAGHLPPEAMGPASERFRELYPKHAIEPVGYLPSAVAALEAVRQHGGRIVVITGKFPPNAQLHVDHLGMDIDLLEGWVWGAGKAEVLRREGAQVYVGDHVHDVAGALAAGVTSVSVSTGGSTEEQLVAAGSHVVLPDLSEFPAWLDGFVADRTATRN